LPYARFTRNTAKRKRIAMKNTAKKIGLLAILVAVAILLVFTALRRPPKPAAALSRAAKERIEALDDALKHGLISRPEHDKRVAQIVEDDTLVPNPNQPAGNDDAAPSPSHED
jgi:hypothetical protein